MGAVHTDVLAVIYAYVITYCKKWLCAQDGNIVAWIFQTKIQHVVTSSNSVQSEIRKYA